MLNLLQLLPGRIIKMSADKEKVASNCYPQQRNRHYSAETTFKTRLRRRQLYKQLSPDKKETLLSQRRSRKLESRSQCVLFGCNKEALCSKARVELHRETPLTIRESSCVNKKADISSADDTIPAFDKEKAITSHFSVFEFGSTSAARHEEHNPGALAITNKVAHTSSADETRPTFAKGKAVTGYSSVFELDSTSVVPHEQHGPAALAITNEEKHVYEIPSTADNFSPEYLLDYLNLSSKHHGLEVANKIDAILHVWRLENCCYSSHRKVFSIS